MKTIKKLLLFISIFFFLLTVALTITTVFYNYYFVIGNCGTSQILTIFASIDIIFVSAFLLLNSNLKKLFVIFSVVLLILTDAIMLTITFLPKYNYTVHPAIDNYYTIMVEEKTSHDQVSITFSKKTSGIFYKHMYAVTFTEKKKDNYKLGDYTIAFDDKYTRINLPSNNKTQILIPH